MSKLLILTVGTGTAGLHSDVAAGLARTIDLAKPRLFWLVPSQSEKSTPVADLIRESVQNPRAFCPWSPTANYHAIANPDDIHLCRQVIREVIAAAKKHLQPGERLVINPTGGTKQMSAAATLAALDEQIGEIMFTTGERADGVVKTGTEKPKTFYTETFFLERDLRTAQELFDHGAFFGAARLLLPHKQPPGPQARATALCLHEWQRMNYRPAAAHAALFSDKTRAHLERLAQEDPFSPSLLGDLLAGADELLRWGDCEEALARYYRAAEQTAKVRLADAHSIRPPYQLRAVLNLLPAGGQLATRLVNLSRQNQLFITAQLAWEILATVQDPIAADYFTDHALVDGLSRRNETMYGHASKTVEPQQVKDVAARLRKLLAQHLPAALACWTVAPRPRSLT